MKMHLLSAPQHRRLQRFVYNKLLLAQMRRYPIKHQDRWERWLVLLAPKTMLDQWPDRYRRPQ